MWGHVPHEIVERQDQSEDPTQEIYCMHDLVRGQDAGKVYLAVSTYEMVVFVVMVALGHKLVNQMGIGDSDLNSQSN